MSKLRAAARWASFKQEHCKKSEGEALVVNLHSLLEAYRKHTGDDETTEEEFLALVHDCELDEVNKHWARMRNEDGSFKLACCLVGGLCLKEDYPDMLASMKQLCLQMDDPIKQYRECMNAEPDDKVFLQAARKQRRRSKLQHASLFRCCGRPAGPVQNTSAQSLFADGLKRLQRAKKQHAAEVVLMQGQQQLWCAKRMVRSMFDTSTRAALLAVTEQQLQQRGLRLGEDGVHLLWRWSSVPNDPRALLQGMTFEYAEGFSQGR